MGKPTKEIRAKREQESIVCDFLRKISPEREWMYLGEVEHAWISEMVRAIAATVGTGTCHMNVHDNRMGEVWLVCDECHWQMQLEPTTPRFKYCPNCGARVVPSET